MSDTDQSLYNLRYNQITLGLEGFGGGTPQWTPLSLGGGGTPGGDSGQLQYNDSGAFAGSPSFIVDPTNAAIQIRDQGVSGTILELDSSTFNDIHFGSDGGVGTLASIHTRAVDSILFTACSSLIVGPVFPDPTPDPSVKLAVVSTTSGFLPPVMATTDKEAIATPAEGLIVYDTTLHKLSVWTGSAWEIVTSA